MTVTIGRRELLAALGGAAAAWPLAARAQQPAMPIVGFVTGRSPEESARLGAAFRKGLNQTGYVDGQNVTVEYHWLGGQYNRLPSLMTDLVGRRVAVIAPLVTGAGLRRLGPLECLCPRDSPNTCHLRSHQRIAFLYSGQSE